VAQADRLPRLPGGSELRNSLPLWLVLSPPGASPDKRRLMTVQDFFSYAEDEGAASATLHFIWHSFTPPFPLANRHPVPDSFLLLAGSHADGDAGCSWCNPPH
jgi:hypothetical protein